MKLQLALPVLGLLLCAADTMAQENTDTMAQDNADTMAQDNGFGVVISKTKVTLTCPRFVVSSIEWKKNEASLPGVSKEQVYVIEEYESSKHDGEYTCESGTPSLKLHLKAKVCRNCEELDVLTVAGIIIADFLITLGVLILVYYFSKNRKGRVGGSAGVHPKGQKMVRPPPVPNPDYEPIRKGQRDLYAGLQSRGF